MADAVLAGAFTGDFAVALERGGAFCRVVSTGWALLADDDPTPSGRRSAPASASRPAADRSAARARRRSGGARGSSPDFTAGQAGTRPPTDTLAHSR